MPMYRPRFVDQLSSKLSRLGSSDRKKMEGQAKVRRASRLMAESLESRVMLTVITTTNAGGEDTLTFKSIREVAGAIPTGHFVTIAQSGNTTATYAAAFVNEFDQAEVTDVPGVISNGTISNGGYGGEQGTQHYGYDNIVDPILGLSYTPYQPDGGTAALRIDALAAYANGDPTIAPNYVLGYNGTPQQARDPLPTGPAYGMVFGLNLDTAGNATVIQIIEFPDTGVTAVNPPLIDADPQVPGNAADQGLGIVIADLVLPTYTVAQLLQFNTAGQLPNYNTLNQEFPQDETALLPDGTPFANTFAKTITAAAFNPANGYLYFVIAASGPTKFNELYSVQIVDPNSTPGANGVGTFASPQQIQQSLFKYNGQFGAQAAIPASTGVLAQPAITSSVSAITFLENPNDPNRATMYAFDIYTMPTGATATNPTGTAGTPTGYIDAYPYPANPAPLGLGQEMDLRNLTGNVKDEINGGIGNELGITGLAFEPNFEVAADGTREIYATTSNLGPAGGGNVGGGGNTEAAELLRIDLASGAGTVVADLADPAPTGGVGSTFELGNDVQDLIWEPEAVDSITGATGAFVGTDAESNELVVISTSDRSPSSYLFSIIETAGDLSDSNISFGAPTINDYDYLTGVPVPGAPSGDLTFAGDSGDVDGLAAPANSNFAYLGLKVDLTAVTTAVTTSQYPDVAPGSTLTAGFHSLPGVEIDNLQIVGTVTGDVDFEGNARNFVAGWLISSLEASNDLRNVWVQTDAGSLGGFAPVIQGHIDQFRVVGTLEADVTVEDTGTGINDEIDPDTGLPYIQEQLLSYLPAGVAAKDGIVDPFVSLENYQGAVSNPGTGLFPLIYAYGDFVQTDGAFNDTFALPQYLGSLSAANQVVTVDATYDTEAGTPPDVFYGVALLAGQTITVQDDPGGVEVFDPDGRLVYSDSSTSLGDDVQVPGEGAFGPTLGQPFQFKPDRPGTYRFEVPDGSELNVGLVDTNGNPGDIALGGIYAGTFGSTTSNSSVEVVQGDIGAVHADGSILSVSEITDVGNLRDTDASDIGLKVVAGGAEALSNPVLYTVPVGSIGLVRSTDANPLTGILYLEPATLDPNVLDPVQHQPYLGLPVGVDVQIVQSAYTLATDLSANYAIGTIQAVDEAVAPANTFAVNPDNNPAIAGRIDLIDNTGNFGDLADGGPAITTGPNGDVGFINVGGAVFEDSYFGGGAQPTTLHDPGVPVTVTDDGGANITFTPVGTLTPNPAYNASAPAAGVSQYLGPQLSLTTYGIRGSGGVVVINVTVTNDGSLNVVSNGNGASKVAEVSNIDVTAAGPNVIDVANQAATVTNAATGALSNLSNSAIISATLPSTAPAGGNTAPNTNIIPIELDPASALSCTVNISGTSNVDVYDITGGNFSSINNQTAGEIINVTAGSIGALVSGGTIGVASHTSTPAALYPARVISSAYPFVQQHYGIVSGNIVQVSSASAVGNFDVTGSIGSIIADSGHATNPAGVFAGIDGPIVASSQIVYVDIGQGVESSGSGDVGFAGIYAGGVIGLVTNTRRLADIRGAVVSNTEINAVVLTNASIINAQIDTITPTAGAEVYAPPPVALIDLSPTVTSPIWTIGQITIKGDGGMIGDLVESGAIGPTLLTNGAFGIFYTNYSAADGNGLIATVTASGYGIRNSSFMGGASMEGFNATGNGSLISTNVYPSELFVQRTATPTSIAFDPYFGLLPSVLTDLDANLQTDAAAPNIARRTDTGVIEDSSAKGGRDLGFVTAQNIREVFQVDIEGAPLLPNPTTVNTTIPGEGGFGTAFDFANSIGTVKVRDAINGLELTTGRLAAFTVQSISRMGITVAGTITNMVIHGNYGNPVNNGETQGSQVAFGDSFIQAVGPNGNIRNLTVMGNLDATVYAEGDIGRLTVYESIRGNVTIAGKSTGLALGVLHVGAFLDQSTLNINGSVGSIIANGGFGVAGDSLTITGNLGSLQVGALRSNSNSSLGMALTVLGNLGKATIRGHIDGSIQVNGSMGTLAVQNDGSSSNLIAGPVNVLGSIGSVTLTNGNITSSVTAGGTIKSIALTRGSVEASASFQSSFGSIQTFKVAGGAQYGLFGSLLAPKGNNEKILVSGNIGDGVDPAIVTANTGTSFVVDGSILSNTTITVANALKLLQVNGNIYTGAVIAAHPLVKQKIKGTNTGSITVI